MATRTSSQTGVASASSTWGGATLANGDIVIVATGHAVTFDADYTLGSKAAGVGAAMTIQATNAGTFGSVIVNSGVTLTLRGFDTAGTNTAMTINQFGLFNPSAGSTVSFDFASDWQSYVKCNGNITSNGATWTIPSANVTWSNASGARAITATVSAYNLTNGVYQLKLNTATVTDPGMISNSGGTALGSLADTSLVVSAGGFDTNGGTVHVEKAIGAVAGNLDSNLTTAGDYCIDYATGVLLYKSNSPVLIVTFSYKYASWFSWGVVATNNATGSAILMDNNNINYCGATGTTQGEFLQGGFICDDKFSPTLDATRAVRFSGNTFTYCTRCIQLYNSNTTGANSSNHISISGNTFTACRYNQNAFADGALAIGTSCHYVDVANNVFNGTNTIFVGIGRNTVHDLVVSGTTGTCIGWHFMSAAAVGSTFQNNTLTCLTPFDTLGNIDPTCFQVTGTLAGGNNVYQDNVISGGPRAGRLDNYMTVRRNIFKRAYHHGFIFRSQPGYITGVNCSNNVIYDCSDANNLGGGWTSNYNTAHWIDNCNCTHNTFDTGTRTVSFNDQETSCALVTRCSITDNILSNSLTGIYKFAGDASNFSSLALTQVDYNDDYNNTGLFITNVKQGTFMFGGANYNSSGSKTCAGCYIFNPNYTLPDATNRSLVLTVAGTNGSTKSVKVAWGGGSQIEYVAFQGTATAVTPGTGSIDPNSVTFPTLTDGGKSFTTTNTGLKGYQVAIVGGTGSGQFAMISANTATALTLIPNTLNGIFATPLDTTSVYLVLKPDQTLTDATTGTVSCGLYSPTLQTTNGTYTDASITIAKNYPGTTGANNGVNPSYVSSSNFSPQNTALRATGSDAADIGALAGTWPVAASGSPTRRRHFGGLSTAHHHRDVREHG